MIQGAIDTHSMGIEALPTSGFASAVTFNKLGGGQHAWHSRHNHQYNGTEFVGQELKDFRRRTIQQDYITTLLPNPL